MASSDKYRVSSSHPEDLADGRVVGPGEEVSSVDTSSEHNKRLIDAGVLVKITRTGKSSVRAKNEKEDG